MNDLQHALGALAPDLSPGATTIVGLRRLSGGASQETWAFETDDGAPLILRRKPPGVTGSANAVPLATEAALINAAAARGAPVPRVVAICAPDSDVGEAYVMSRVEGETLGKRIARDPPFAEVRKSLARQCGEVLAAIHKVPTEGLPPLAISSAATPNAEVTPCWAAQRNRNAKLLARGNFGAPPKPPRSASNVS
jgi:aminoglycoside phosphotransferase (APT) family kinase protein